MHRHADARLAILVLLALVAFGVAGGGAVSGVVATFDHEAVVGTDSAEIALLDPLALEAHRHEPFGWQYTAGATLADREAGAMLRFDTGGDGGYGVRVTDGPLRPREASHASASVELRLRVGTEGLLLDGGYAWPEADDPEIDETYGVRLDVPPGDYAATVTAIDRPVDASGRYLDVDADGGPVADYVIRLRAVDDLDTVPMMTATPVLVASAPMSTRAFEPMSRFEERCDEVPPHAIVTSIEEGSVPAPGGRWYGSVPAELQARVKAMGTFDAVSSADVSSFFLMLVPAGTPPSVGVVMEASQWSLTPGRDGVPDRAKMGGRTLCAVRAIGAASVNVTVPELAEVATLVAIEPLPLDVAADDGGSSDALVAAYRKWLGTSGRKDVRYRLAAIDEATDPRHRFAQIVTVSEPPAARVAEWLATPATARDLALGVWLEERAATGS